MSQPQHYSGPELGALLARVRKELGEDATILEANKVRSGGIGGFFTKESFQITASNEDNPAPAVATLGAEATALMNDDFEDFEDFESVRDYLAQRDQTLESIAEASEDVLEPLDVIGDLSHTLADKRVAARKARNQPQSEARRQAERVLQHATSQRASTEADPSKQNLDPAIQGSNAAPDRPSISLNFDRLGPPAIPSRLGTTDPQATRAPVPTPGPLRSQLNKPAPRQAPQSIGSVVADRLMERAELMNALEHLETTDQMIEAHQDGASHHDMLNEASFDAILGSTLSDSYRDEVDANTPEENALATAEAVALRIAEQNNALYDEQDDQEQTAEQTAEEPVIDIAAEQTLINAAAAEQALIDMSAPDLVLDELVEHPEAIRANQSSIEALPVQQAMTTQAVQVPVMATQGTPTQTAPVQVVQVRAVVPQIAAEPAFAAEPATIEPAAIEPAFAPQPAAIEPARPEQLVLASAQSTSHSDGLTAHSPLPSGGGNIPDRLVETSAPFTSSREPLRSPSEVSLGSNSLPADEGPAASSDTSIEALDLAIELEQAEQPPEIQMLETLDPETAPIEPAGARQRPDFWTRMALAKEEISLYRIPKAKVTAIIGPLDLALPIARRCQNDEWIGAENLAVLSNRTSIPGLPSWQTVSKADDLYWAVNEWRETQQRGLVVVDTNELSAEKLIRLVASIRSNGADMVRVTLPAGVDLDSFLTMAAELGEPVAVDLPEGTSPQAILAAVDAGICVASIGPCALTAELLVALRSEVNGD